jgi:hypothetical protein
MKATRKVGEEVDVQQFYPGIRCEGVCFMTGSGCMAESHVHTAGGPMCINAGDWVIHRNGKTWVVEGDEFPGLYDLKTNEVPMQGGESPGMAWRDIAASAYRAYAASTGNKNFRGEPMPEFDALPQPIRTAWEAAVRQAGSLAAVSMSDAVPEHLNEQRWSGWVPPHLS